MLVLMVNNLLLLPHFMNNCLIYTFKNFPYKSVLGNFAFEFNKLKSDLLTFEKEIVRLSPKFIIGVAKSPTNASRFESKAVNIFNHSKKINKSGVDEYKLDYPIQGYKSITVNKRFTDSFCNWTMYKVSNLIIDTDIKLQFIHVSEDGLLDLQDYLNLRTENAQNDIIRA